jgi:Ca-activated chloride channel family protein
VAAPRLEVDVEIRVTGLVARGTVTQRFRNRADRWIEGAYLLPLPDGAAVDGLRMRVGDRIVEGEIREREAAQRAYAAAREDGRRASILEQRRPDVFATRVANIGPGAEVEVSVDLQWTLRLADGEFTLRLPWIVAPRFGGPARGGAMEPGAAHTPPPEPAGGAPSTGGQAGPRPDVALAIDFDPGFPVSSLGSPTHAIALEHLGPTRLLLTLRDGPAPADRDFVLRFRPAPGDAPRAAIFSETSGARDGAHHLMLLLVPPDARAHRADVSREVVFVIDTSGSMDGPSIRQARRAVALALDRLGPRDRFNVVAFDSTTRTLFRAPVPADPVRLKRARRWVAGLEASGGTVMAPALAASLHDAEPAATDLRQVVFVTDGAVAEAPALFALVRERLGRSRLFTVGIGSAPNGHFLAGAARFGRGSHVDVASPDELGERMAALFRRLERPVLTDVEVAWHDAVEAWPARVPDLYPGEPLVVTARLERLVGDVRVRGRRDGEPWEVRLPVGPGRPEAGIARLWAREKIRARMDAVVAGEDAGRVRADVLELALRYGLVSRWTSLVAVERTPVRPRGEDLARTDVAAGLPHGWRLPQGATAAPAWTLLATAALLAAGGVALPGIAERLARRGTSG